ncbi:MAG: efflux RND transporter periplasmic adaptor subunit, partial [Cyanobacteria bacterium J06641_5]
LSLLGVAISRMRAVLVPTETVTAQENEGALLPVNVLQIVPVSSYEVARAYTGEIAALRASDLGFERGGRLVDVLVREGDRVTAGQPIAQLDTQNLQAQRRQLEAEKARAVAQFAELQAGPRSEDIAAAEAEVRDLEQQLLLVQAQRSRREFLHNEGAISKEELDEFTFDRGALQARLERAQSNLAELRNGTRPEQIDAQQALVRQLDANIADIEITIGKSAIAAPFAGLVAARQVDEGTVLSAGQAVVRLVEDATPEARIGLPTDRTARLRLGETQTLQFGDRAYSATVAAVLPEIDPQTRTQEVIFALEPAATPYAKPGQTVRVELTETVSAEGFWLPIGALTRDIRGLWSCYVLVPTQAQDTAVVETVSVEILHQEAERVLVRGTLQSSDRIVADGIHRLVPGQKVRTDKTATPKRLARQ